GTGVFDVTDTNLVLTGTTVNGSLQSTGTNKILLQGANTLVNVTNNSTQLEIGNGQAAFLTGTLTNNGNLQVASAGNQTFLLLNGNVTLGGTGTVTLSGPGNGALIMGASGAGTEVLTNAAGHTIRGEGILTQLTLLNSGTLRSTGAGLSIQNISLTNTGTGVFDVTDTNLVLTGTTVNGSLQSTGTNKILLQGANTLV